MPGQNPQPPATPSPFEIVTPTKSNKGGKKGMVVATLVVIFLLLSVVAGVLLVRNNQNVQEKAAGNCDNPPSIVQCPRSDGALVSCTPPDVNNNAQISLCNVVGRIETCGGAQYCCPVAGGAWTTSMTACGVVGSPPAIPTRGDYCVSASVNGGAGGIATMNSGETVTLSSVSNTAVNGFYFVAYNSDNLYGPGNPKPICSGSGSHDQCPNGGTPLTFSATDKTTLRTTGSTQVAYNNIFVTDKSTGQQVKNVQINGYFSLNNSEWSIPQPACVAYAKMAIVGSPAATATAVATVSPAATATATAVATVSPTATPVPTLATGTTIPVAQTTPLPIPATGTGWPTYLGAGVGILVILASILIAL